MTYPDAPLMKVLHGEAVSPPPVWLMRQAGRYLPEYQAVRKDVGNFLELCYNPELAAQVTMQPITRFGFDAAIIFSDILVIPDALGQKVVFIEKKGPVLEPISAPEDITKLSFNQQMLSPVYEAIKQVRQQLSDNKTLIGFSGSPWTLATYMIEGGGSKDFQKVKGFFYAQEEAFKTLIYLLADSIAQHLIEQINAGADVVKLFDSWAGVLDEEAFMKWVVEPTRHIITKINSVHPEVPVIGFPKGSGVYSEYYAQYSGVDALAFDQHASLGWVRDHIKLPVQGNLDPVLLATNKEKMLERVRQLKEHFANRPFIVNLGHGILPYTPIENVEALVEEVRRA